MSRTSPWARCWAGVALAGILAAGCGPAAARRTPPGTGGTATTSSRVAAAGTAPASPAGSTAAPAPQTTPAPAPQTTPAPAPQTTPAPAARGVPASVPFGAAPALTVQAGAAATMIPPSGYVPGAVFATAAFPSAGDGWVGGAVGPGCNGSNPHDTGGIIEATADNGARWRVQYRGGDAVLALAFAGASDGWALAVPAGDVSACGRPLPGQLPHQVLLATADGGRTWDTADPRATGLDALYFTAAGGWAGRSVCTTPAAGNPSCSGALLRSTDGGGSWQAIPGADPGGLPVIAVTGRGRVLWALEAGPTGDGRSGYRGGLVRVMRSTDGGRSWTGAGRLPLAQPGQTAGAVGSLLFTSATRGWATVWAPTSCTMGACATDAVFRTADGGRNWSPVTAGQPRCNVARPLVASGRGTVLVSRGVNLAACAGPATTVVRSTDGGSAWRTAATWPRLGPVALFGAPGPAGATVFWALAAQTLLRSTDAGTRWAQSLPAPVPTAGLQFVSAHDGWGVGTLSDPGAILQTTDGGRTWSVVFSVPGAALSGVSFANAADGWVAGATQPWAPQSGRGLLWRTTDGGASWSSVSTAMRLPALPTIAFRSAGLGLLVARGAQIACASVCPPPDLFSTTDGGTRWRSVGAVIHPNRLSAVDITPAGTVWGIWQGLRPGCNLVLAHSAARAPGWTTGGCFAGYTGSPTLQIVSPTAAFAMMLQVLRPASSGHPAVTRPLLLRSTDGGRVWHDSPLPITAGFFGNHLFFLNARRGWLLAGGALWTTTDGGAVWTGVTD